MRRKAKVLVPTDPTMLAYFAGIVDGEGTIRLGKSKFNMANRNPRWLPTQISGQLSVVNTSTKLIKWIEENIGGLSSTYETERLGTKPVYAWVLGGSSCVPILKAILPYLVIKRRRAELVIKLYSEWNWSMGGTRKRQLLTEPELIRREHLFTEYKSEISSGDAAAI